MSGNECNEYVKESCTLKDIRELFEELELYGVPALPEIEEAGSYLCLDDAKSLLKSLVNASYHMLYRHRKVLREYEDLEIKRMRDLDENHALKASIECFKRDLDEKERVLLKKEEQTRRIQESLSKIQQDLKARSEEIRQLRSQLKYSENKNIHEVRKKEQEINKLQIQLLQKSGSQPLRKHRQHLPPKEVKISEVPQDKEQAYQQIICKFEANNKDLILENKIINRALHKLNSDLALLVVDFNCLLHSLPNGKECGGMESLVAQMKKQEELLEPAQDLSLEECIATSNNHIESLIMLVDNFKQKFL